MQSTHLLPTFVAQTRSGGLTLVAKAAGECPLFPQKKDSQSMNVDNAKSQMRKGMLEYCVLLLLSKEACYANDIITRLKQAELIVVEGTLYPLLTRLKKDGLLSYEWRESTQGPPRKYYVLTEMGRSFLAALDTAWNELARTVALVKGMSPQITYDPSIPPIDVKGID